MMFDLPSVPQEVFNDEHALAKRHAPVLYFDTLEPFLPCAVGYTVFTVEAASSSFKRTINLPEGVTTAIEYAIWWDWDIQHLYELEHLWVYLDANENLIRTEASFHGDFHDLATKTGETPTEKGRAVAYSEPGKHAFAGQAAQLKKLEPLNKESCTSLAGKGDVLINHMFEGKIRASRLGRRLTKRYMKAHAFTPSYDFSKRFDLQTVPLLSWNALRAWIPERVNAWLEQLESRLPHLKAVLLDSGDTIIDEGTEVKDGNGIVLSAELIPSADTMMQGLFEGGYKLALVADGEVRSFENVLGHHGLYDLFKTRAISETIGVLKPEKQMFLTALDTLKIDAQDYANTVMVGNNLERDIKGANALGIESIWLDWAPRRSKTPADASEEPGYTIKLPKELLTVLEMIELELAAQFLLKDKYETL